MNNELVVRRLSKTSVMLKYRREVLKMSANMFNKLKDFFVSQRVTEPKPTYWNIKSGRGFIETDVIEIQVGVDCTTCSVLSNTGLASIDIGAFCRRLTVDLGAYFYDNYKSEGLYGAGLLNLLVIYSADNKSLYTFAKSIADGLYAYAEEWFYLDLEVEPVRNKIISDIYALVCAALYSELRG